MNDRLLPVLRLSEGWPKIEMRRDAAAALGEVVGHRCVGGREDRPEHDLDLVVLHELPGLVDRLHGVGGVVGLEVLDGPAHPLVVHLGERGLDPVLGELCVHGHEAGEALVEADLERLAGRRRHGRGGRAGLRRAGVAGGATRGQDEGPEGSQNEHERQDGEHDFPLHSLSPPAKLDRKEVACCCADAGARRESAGGPSAEAGLRPLRGSAGRPRLPLAYLGDAADGLLSSSWPAAAERASPEGIVCRDGQYSSSP